MRNIERCWLIAALSRLGDSADGIVKWISPPKKKNSENKNWETESVSQTDEWGIDSFTFAGAW